MTTNIGDGRLLRVCDLCGGVDDHPRHVIAGVDPDAFAQPDPLIVDRVVESAPAGEAARLLRDLFDTTASDRHMDCCRAVGCPDGLCDVSTAGADDKRGADLLAHLMMNSEESE